MRRALAFLLAVLLPVVAFARPAAGDDDADAYAPTPYTAEQIRACCKKGRKLTFKIEAAGKPVQYSTMEFVAVSDATGTVRSTVADESGKPLAEPSEGEAAWESYRDHARFPAASTKVSEESVTTPAGTFACQVYAVTGESGGKKSVRRFYFAEELPGPPVKLEIAVDGATVYTMTLVEHVPGS